MPVEQAVRVERLSDRVGGSDHPLVLVLDESGHRQAQQGRVELPAVEDLDEDAALAVIAAAFDGLSDLVPSSTPALLGRLPQAGLGEVEGALQRNPAEDLRMGEVPGPGTPLPDAAVRLRPVLGGEVGDVDDEAPVVVVRLVAALTPVPTLLDQLSQHVELHLLGGLVPNADRLRLPVALQIQVDLLLAALPADPVHDLQILGVAGGAALDEAPERIGLAVTAKVPHRAGRKGRVANPAVAVVPVARAGRRLRQRGGRGGHHRAREVVDQRLQRQSGADRPALLYARDRQAGRPVLPEGDRVVERAVQVLGFGLPWRHLVDRGRVRAGCGDPDALGGADRAGPAQLVIPLLELQVSRDHQGVVAAGRGVDVRTVLADPGVDLAVVVARDDLDLEIHRAADPLDDAQDLGPGSRRPLARHRHAVDHGGLAALDPEAGLEHHRVAHIAAVNGGLAPALDGGDREVAAALPVEEPGEGAARVETWQTAPVDGAGARDQRRGLAVADQSVVGDRWIFLAHG